MKTVAEMWNELKAAAAAATPETAKALDDPRIEGAFIAGVCVALNAVVQYSPSPQEVAGAIVSCVGRVAELQAAAAKAEAR